jgi:hypothetical protein
VKLTRQQRALLFAGECPRFTYPGAQPCPVAVGHVEVLSAHVRLEVTGIRRTAKGEHVLTYTLHNNRLGQRFLAVQDGQSHPEQYAHSGGSGVDPEAGEAVDGFTQKRITREAHARAGDRLEQMIFAMEEVRALLEAKVKDNPGLRAEISAELWQIRGRIDAAKAKLKRRAA